jgi:hypothetical protein
MNDKIIVFNNATIASVFTKYDYCNANFAAVSRIFLQLPLFNAILSLPLKLLFKQA